GRAFSIDCCDVAYRVESHCIAPFSGDHTLLLDLYGVPMHLRRGIVMLLACGLGLFVGCLGDGSSSTCQPGTEFCGCSLGLCQPGLECVGNICISSDPDGGETFTTATIGDGDGD